MGREDGPGLLIKPSETTDLKIDVLRMPLTSRPLNYNLRSLGEAPVVEPEAEVIIPIVEKNIIEHNFEPNIMAIVFKLDNFKGDGTQTVESYLKRFDQYRMCTGINDDQALATLAWHLDGNARLWLDQLAPEPTTLNDLKVAMNNKFKRPMEINMDVYTMKQTNGETVDQFLRRLEAETYKCKINNDTQVQIALNGMDRTIASAISTHAPKTLDDVKQLTSRMGSIRQGDANVSAADRTSSLNIPSKLETTVEVLTAAVAKLAATVEKKAEPGGCCSRCGGRCFSLANCRTMGKTCNKCHKLNHFESKCRSTRVAESKPNRHYQHQGYAQQSPRPRQYYNNGP